MTLRFDISETGALAFSQRYYRCSPAHIKTRNSTRLFLPIILAPLMFFFIYKFGFSLLATALFLGAMIAWYTLYPRRFDSRVRKHLKKQMQESGYANMFGSYEININDDHLASVGPTGDSKHKWNAVNRAELSEEYLFVFLSGPQGLPIPVNEIGVDAARQACDAINQNVKNATI